MQVIYISSFKKDFREYRSRTRYSFSFQRQNNKGFLGKASMDFSLLEKKKQEKNKNHIETFIPSMYSSVGVAISLVFHSPATWQSPTEKSQFLFSIAAGRVPGGLSGTCPSKALLSGH